MVDLPNLDPINGSLTELHLAENNFEGKELVFNLPELTHLYLTTCSITIWPDVYGCPKLKELELTLNSIPSLRASPMLPPDNALEKLYLKGNPITDTFQGIFVENLNHLKWLDLDTCNMSVFPNISLVIDTLGALRLNRNRLTRMDPKAFLGVDNFTSPEIPINGYPAMSLMELSVNQFNFIPSNLFQIFPRVRDFKLVGNKNIIQVPDFTPLKDSLFFVRVQGNKGPFASFNYETGFLDMTKLQRMDLSNNDLLSFPFSAAHILAHLPVLTSLTLNNNLINRLPDLSSLGMPERGVSLTVRFSYFLKMHYG